MSNIKNHVLVNGIKIGKATVISNTLLKKGSCIPGNLIVPTSATYHQTDCVDVDAPRMHLALFNANSDKYAGTNQSNYRQASWTITVGYDKIIQNVPLNWRCYAQGTTLGNNTSISIEMCMYNDKEKTYQTYLNAIALHKVLLRDYNSKLVGKAHYDWSKKICPSWLKANKFGYSWNWFKAELTSSGIVNTVTETTVNQTGKVNTDSLNVRSGAGTTHSKIGSLSKNASVSVVAKCSNGWLKINYNNSYGYVSSDYITTSVTIVENNWANGDYNCKVRTTSNLNIRIGRGTEFGILKTIPKGTTLTLGYVKDKWGSTWDYLTKDGKPTYVHCDYVERV